MNRRGLFGILAAAPLGAVALSKTAAAVPVPPKPAFPVAGTIIDTHVHMPDYGVHQPIYASYSQHLQAVSVLRRKISDGTKLVDYDSAEGAAVITKILTQR